MSQTRRYISLVLLAYDIRLLATKHPRDVRLRKAIDLAQGIAHCGPATARGRLQVIRRLVSRDGFDRERKQAVLRRLDEFMASAEVERQSTKEVITWQRTSPARA